MQCAFQPIHGEGTGMHKYLVAVIGAALIGMAPAASAVPTYDDGDAFAEDVYDHGILEDLPKDHLVQILANICYQASTYPKSVMVAMYSDGYGISGKDAAWMVNDALKRCN